ncbi:hypothetical protein Gogos_020683, partial [Gossypium gossypioides]|nr:hypothetical protein [Gossypium gossypioides]
NLSVGDLSIGSHPVPSKDGISRATKKVRLRPAEPSDSKDHIVNENGVKVDALDGQKEGDLKEQPKSKGEELHKRVEEEQFGPWILVERRQWRSSRTTTYKSSMVVDKTVGGSRFGALDENLGESNGENDSFDTINAEKEDARMEGNPPKSVYVPKKGKLIQRDSPNSTINKGKGKRIAVSSGAKSNARILKPSKNRGEQSTGLGFSSIEDGSTMRSNKEKYPNSLLGFQAVRVDTTLVGSKNRVVKMVESGKQKNQLKENIEPNVTMHGEAVKGIVRKLDRTSENTMDMVGEDNLVEISEDEMTEHDATAKDSHPDVISLFETRVSGRKADSVISRLGFPNSFRVEAVGFAGGIWI